LGDLLKGSLAMRLALALELEPWGVIMAFIAVVLGHLYPAQLGFRGGKGAAVGFGAVLVLDFPLAMILLAMAALIFALTRAFTLSGLITIALAPAIAWLLGNHGAFLIGLVIVVLLLLYAHRSNILALARGQRGAATLE
jgi:glycerol-3-phosphate acyltransferase PlsY